MLGRKNAGAAGRLTLLVILLASFLSMGGVERVVAHEPFRTQQAVEWPFNDLQGATYDQETGELILIGNDVPSLPPIDETDLTVALRTRYDFLAHPRDYWPGVTIEFSLTNSSVMDVIYFGNVRDTHFGYVLFESDRLLKYYGMGYDNSSGVPVPITSNVPGYKSELACLSEHGYTPPAGKVIQWRKWFSPTLSIHATTDDTAIAFAQARMTLNWAYDSSTHSPIVEQCVQTFVDHFNAHYREFADEQQARGNPVLHELVQIAKLLAVAEWLQSRDLDSKIPGLNAPWLKGLPTTFHTTPHTTPLINVTVGSLIQSGGVDLFIPPQSFISDDGTARDLASAVLESRPGRLRNWPYRPCRRVFATLGVPEPKDEGGNCQAFAGNYAYNQIDPHKLEKDGEIVVEEVGLRNQAVFLLRYAALLAQEIILPADGSAKLFFWFGQNRSQNTQPLLLPGIELPTLPSMASDAAVKPTAAPRDFLYVRLIPENGNPVVLQTITDQDESGIWIPSAGFDLSAYNGQRVRLEFVTEIPMGVPDPTVFFIGAMQLNTDPPPPPPLNLKIVKTTPATRVTLQDEIRYTITLTNHNTAGQIAANVVVTDTLPTGLSYVAGSTSDGTGEPTGGSTLIWNLPTTFDLLPGASKSFSFSVKVVSGKLDESFVNTAMVSSSTSAEDSDPSDNIASSVPTILGPKVTYLPIILR